ncbi:MAG: TonB-dependent receptor [Opitutus sp.]|nr:TonB-dependent receptor [Opitutus sp.]
MNLIYISLRLGIAALIAASACRTAAGQSSSPAQPEKEEPITLSPFVVTGAGDQGYAATATLSGTRLKTDLRNLGASISVATPEMMKDLGATDAGSLLAFMANTEVGGLQGNFSGAENAQNGRYFQNDARTDPQFNQRVRGVGRAALTRNLFLTDIPFDTFNTERLTINRGANSLLFGIGEPGGVIDNSLKQADLRKTFTSSSFRFGTEGSTRSEIEHNQVLVKDRIGFRVAGLKNADKFQQKPAWEKADRYYGAAEVVLFKNERSNGLDPTRLRINAETGRSKGSPVQIIPPSVAYSNWFEPVPLAIQRYSGIAPPAQVVSPSEGGTWRFQQTYNPFLQSAENQINTNVHPVVFRQMAIVYGDARAVTPLLRAGDTAAQPIQGLLGINAWATNLDTVASVGVAGTPGVASLTGNSRLGQYVFYGTNSPYAEPFAIGFAVPTLQNRKVFDYREQVYSGGLDQVERKFQAKNAVLEQTFLKGRFGVEAAYDLQRYETLQQFYFTGGKGTSTTGPYDIYVDIAEYLPNGQPNPNLGRAFSRVANPKEQTRRYERETKRLTAFSEIDFARDLNLPGWLGRHRFSGLYSDHTLKSRQDLYGHGWDSDTEDVQSIVNDGFAGAGRRQFDVIVYTSDSLRGLSSPNDVRLQQINIARPSAGQQYNLLFTDVGKTTEAARRVQTGVMKSRRFLVSQDLQKQNVESQVLSWEGNLLSDQLVGVFGWRRDKTKAFNLANEAEAGTTQLLANGIWNPAFTRLSAKPALAESGRSLTWSVVGRFPEKLLFQLPGDSDLQAHYAQSENFNPIGLRNSVLAQPIGQPTGTTREYGVLVSSLGNKVSLKLNWFQTVLKNTTAGDFADVGGFVSGRVSNYLQSELDGAPFSNALVLVSNPQTSRIQSYAQFYAAMIGAMPQELRAVLKPRFADRNNDGRNDAFVVDPISNLAATADRAAKGMEIELVANLTKNWRAMLNVSRQRTIQTNTAVENAKVAEAFDAALNTAGLSPLTIDAGTAGGAIRPIGEFWIQQGLSKIRATRAKDGTVSNEQREWRVSGLTRFGFDRGRLKGFGFGGSFRWEGAAATGYVTTIDRATGIAIPDVSRPFMDNGLFTADAFCSYERRLNQKLDWSIQLNAHNIFGNSNDIPIATNPDGKVAVIRIPNPATWFIANTFKF